MGLVTRDGILAYFYFFPMFLQIIVRHCIVIIKVTVVMVVEWQWWSYCTCNEEMPILKN